MLDDESSLAKEEARPQGDVKKEISALEEEADLPIEEVIRRMKERAEAEGEEDDDEEEYEEGSDEDDDDEDEDSDDDGEEGEEEARRRRRRRAARARARRSRRSIRKSDSSVRMGVKQRPA